MTVVFNKKIYSLKAIKKAINAYKQLADFELLNKRNYFKISLKNIDKELSDILLDEFCNYVLYELIIEYKHGRIKS